MLSVCLFVCFFVCLCPVFCDILPLEVLLDIQKVDVSSRISWCRSDNVVVVVVVAFVLVVAVVLLILSKLETKETMWLGHHLPFFIGKLLHHFEVLCAVAEHFNSHRRLARVRLVLYKSTFGECLSRAWG